MSFFGVGTQADEGVATQSTGTDNRVADADTRYSFEQVLGSADSTRYAGRVWTDKSVSTNDITFTSADSGVNDVTTKIGDSDFLVTYSALATSQQITQLPKVPVDVVFVLDFSASMCWRTDGVTVGNEDGSDSRIKYMVDALNSAIDSLVKDNREHPNRIGIVCFNGSGFELLPLTELSNENIDGIQDTDGDGIPNYLELKNFSGTTGQDDGKAEVACHIGEVRTAETNSRTNIQDGLYTGMSMLANASDTTFEYSGSQYTRIPSVVLMSDGAPTTISINGTSGNWWSNIPDSPVGWGDNGQAWSANGMLPMLTAQYMKAEISAHYSDNASQVNAPNQDQASASMYTIGFGINNQNKNMVALANLVLNPQGNWNRNDLTTDLYPDGNDTPNSADNSRGDNDAGFKQVCAIIEQWDNYVNNRQATVQYVTESSRTAYDLTLSHPSENDPSSDVPNYVDQYFPANNADDLSDAFRQITNAITESAQAPTEVNGSPLSDGYITYTDPIGDYMEFDGVKTLIYAGQEFSVTQQGEPRVAEDNGVKTTVTEYRASGQINSPVYGDRDASLIEITLTSTENASGEKQQELTIKVPAAAIPLRVNEVDVMADGATVERNENNGAFPLRVVYGVSLQDGVLNQDGTINMQVVSADYLAKNQNADGTVNFYSNRYSAQTEADGTTYGDAKVTFEPSNTNPFYFVQEDTQLYTGTLGSDGELQNQEEATELSEGQSYYFQIGYYEGSGENALKTAWIERTYDQLKNIAVNRDGKLILPEGAPRLGNLVNFDKEASGDGIIPTNATGTAASRYYPTFEYRNGSDNAHEGQFVIYLGNNGRLKAGAFGSLSISKAVAGEGADESKDFTFTVELKQGETPLTGDYTYKVNNGNNQTLSLNEQGRGSIVLSHGETAVIVGLPSGTQYTVTEDNYANEGYTTEKSGDIGTISAAADAKASFTNTYKPREITLSGNTALKLNKKVVGADTDENFSFTATFNADESAKQDPAGTASGIKGYGDSFKLTGDVSENFSAGETKSVSLSEVTFTEPGTYVFDVTEDQQPEPNGWSYDSSIKQIVVKIKDNGSGQLVVDGDVAVPTFTNIYFNNGEAKDVFATDDNGNKTGSSIDGQLVGIGDTLTYEVAWTNATPEPAKVVVTDNIPTGTRIAQNAAGVDIISNGGVLSDGSITWDLGTKQPGDSGTVSFAVVVTEDAVAIESPENTVTNKATIAIGENDSKIELDTNTTENPVPENPVKDVFKNDDLATSIDGKNVAVGDVLTYQVTWTAPASGADDVVITDAVPDGTVLDESSLDSNASVGGNVITWNIGHLDGGKSVTVTFKVKVDESASGNAVENAATVQIGKNGPKVDSNTVNNPVEKLPSSVSTTINATKTLTGRDWIDADAFTFTLSGVNDKGTQDGFRITTENPVIVTKKDAVKAAKSDKTEGVKVPFSWKVAFNQAGTYTFTITEDTTGLAEKGVTSKAISQQVTVVVTDVKGIKVLDEPAVVDFVNTYSPKDGTSNLRATKTVNGESKNIAAGAFTFKIEAVTDGASLPKGVAADGTVTNAAGGAIDFGTFDFAETGKYIYHVSEVNDGKAGYTYDATTYTVVFNVTDDDLTNNALDVTCTIYKGTDTTGALTNDITFVNNYHPEKVTTDASFSGTKAVTNEHGSFGALKGGEFTFVMADAQGNEVKTVQNDAAGNFSFGTLTFAEPGTYTYTVCEQNTSIAGITYDGQVYTLTFNVEDKDGKLTVTSQTITNAAGEKVNADGLNFTNIYNDGQASVNLVGTKTLDTGTFKGGSLREGAFTFVLLDQDGKEIARTTNGAPNGNTATFAFSSLTYTDKDLGQHVYRVVELGADGQPGTGGTDDDNITHSTQVYTVTVTVSKDADAQGSNALKAEAVITNADGQEVGGISFTNTYAPTPGVVGPGGSVQIGGAKQLSGRALNAGEFTFELLQGDQVIDTATNNADGSFTFSKDLPFEAEGTYTYAVREAAGSLGGVSYDDALYTVTITVTEDAESHALVPTVTYQLDGKPVDAMTFCNTYTAAPAVLGNLGVAKCLENGELKDGQFTFELTAADGTPMPEETSVTNAANGTVSFGPITYTEPGEYDYTITEVNDGQDGITYDANATRTVHVSVTDNLQGSLVASVDYGENNPAFVNTVETDEPTEPSEPSQPTEPEQPVEPGQPTEPAQPTDAGQADKPQESPKADALPITGDYVPLIAAGAAVLAVALVAGGVIIRRRQQR